MHARVKTFEAGGVEVISTFAREWSEKQPQNLQRVHPAEGQALVMLTCSAA